MYAFKVFVVVVVVVALAVLTPKTTCTSDVTSSMYMYLANHLTPQECQKFTVYLYAEGLEPAAVRELEQHLPSDEPCLSLLTTWNDSAGKEKSFVSVAECLKKIGRNKLAEWLSNTVFTQLSMELNSCFLCNTSSQETTIVSTTSDFVSSRPRLNIQPKTKTESCSADKTFVFLFCDTVCTYFVLMFVVTLVFYSLGLLVDVVKESQHVLVVPKMEYKILEIGFLPQDLAPEDNILDPLLC